MALISVSDVVPVEKDTIVGELTSMASLIEKWRGMVQGINEDEPMDPEDLQSKLRALAGELLLVSGKAESLAKVLTLT